MLFKRLALIHRASLKVDDIITTIIVLEQCIDIANKYIVTNLCDYRLLDKQLVLILDMILEEDFNSDFDDFDSEENSEDFDDDDDF